MVIELKFDEDFMILSKWLIDALSYHIGTPLPPVRIRTHFRIVENLEIDLFVNCDNKRFIFELKKDDLWKVLEQAVARRRLADYVYVVLNLSVSEILSWLRSSAALLKYGVGVISAKDNCIVIPSYKIHLKESKRYANLLNFIGDKRKECDV